MLFFFFFLFLLCYFSVTRARCSKVAKMSDRQRREAASWIWIPHILYTHLSESSCLFIRIIVDSLKQHSGVSRGISFSCSTSPSICLCMPYSVICPSVHSSSSPHSSTSYLCIAWSLCLLIFFDAFVLIFHCLPRPVSQSVSLGGTVKTGMYWDAATPTSLLCLFFTQPGDRSRPLTFHPW